MSAMFACHGAAAVDVMHMLTCAVFIHAVNSVGAEAVPVFNVPFCPYVLTVFQNKLMTLPKHDLFQTLTNW